MNIADRIFNLRRRGHQSQEIASLLGVTPDEVIARLKDPTLADPAGGGGGGGAGGGVSVVEYIAVPLDFNTAGAAVGDGILVASASPGDVLIGLWVRLLTGFNGVNPGIYVFGNTDPGTMSGLDINANALTGGSVDPSNLEQVNTGSEAGTLYDINSLTTPTLLDGSPLHARLMNFSTGGNPGSTVGHAVIAAVIARHP